MSTPRLIFLGDEATAVGLRLAGVETYVVDRETAQQAYTEHAPNADVLLLGEAVAEGLPGGQLERDLAAVQPLLLVLPALRGQVKRETPAELIRRRLGIREEHVLETQA